MLLRVLILSLSFVSYCNVVAQTALDSDVGVAADCIQLYKKFLSGHKNTHCSMFPSCSHYASIAIGLYGFPKGIFYATDRIIRCSHDRCYYPETFTRGFGSLVDYPAKADPVIVNEGIPAPKVEKVKLTSTRDTSMLFLNHLVNSELFHEAHIEIERMGFYSGGMTDSLYQRKLVCCLGTQEYNRGIFEWETKYPETAKGNLFVAMQAAKLYDRYGNTDEAMSVLSKSKSEDSKLNEKKQIYLYVLTAKRGEYNQAIDMLSVINVDRKEENKQVLNDLLRTRRKNPTLAGILAIVPGLGYLYSGHKGSGLGAFVLNGILGYATYTSIKNENYGVAALCGFVSFSFYIGNVTGSVKSANRYNTKLHNEAIERLYDINQISYY